VDKSTLSVCAKDIPPICGQKYTVQCQFVAKSILSVCAKELSASLWLREYRQFVLKSILPVCGQEYTASLWPKVYCHCAKEYTVSFWQSVCDKMFIINLCQIVNFSVWHRVYTAFVECQPCTVSLCRQRVFSFVAQLLVYSKLYVYSIACTDSLWRVTILNSVSLRILV
jgi:hypothetical protein